MKRIPASCPPGFFIPYSFFAGAFVFCTNVIEAELMQYRCPVGAGPSSNTWPRCPPQRGHSTSIRCIPRLMSSCVATALDATGAEKLGQPQPESNFASDANNSNPQAAHL